MTKKAAVIYLINENPEAHGLHDAPTETTSEVYCTVTGVGMRETYLAKNTDLNPELTFDLALADDYKGQKNLTYEGRLWHVVRTYPRGFGLEIVVERGRLDE